MAFVALYRAESVATKRPSVSHNDRQTRKFRSVIPLSVIYSYHRILPPTAFNKSSHGESLPRCQSKYSQFVYSHNILIMCKDFNF